MLSEMRRNSACKHAGYTKRWVTRDFGGLSRAARRLGKIFPLTVSSFFSKSAATFVPSANVLSIRSSPSKRASRDLLRDVVPEAFDAQIVQRLHRLTAAIVEDIDPAHLDRPHAELVTRKQAVDDRVDRVPPRRTSFWPA